MKAREGRDVFQTRKNVWRQGKFCENLAGAEK